MKIHSTNVAQTSVPAAGQLAGAASCPGDASAEPTGATDAFTPSAEWLRLLAFVKQDPEIRAERVKAAAERLQNGDYFSSASAVATATAMLHGLD